MEVIAAGLLITNGVLEALYMPGPQAVELTDKASGIVFAQFYASPGGVARAEASGIHHPVFGAGRALEFRADNGDAYRVMLFPGLPFALIEGELAGPADGVREERCIQLGEMRLEAGAPCEDLVTLGTGGLTGLDRPPGSYAYAAIAHPRTRRGIVGGWITDDRGSGVVFTGLHADAAVIDAQIDYGHLRIHPGTSVRTETFAIGYFEDARLGLEAYADAIARVYDIQLPPQPVGYCTWYSNPHGGASDEEHIAELSAFTAKELKPFGFSVVQIDDGWQDGQARNGPRKNFTAHRSDGPYPSGVKATANRVAADGLVPGLWFMPFAGDHLDPFFAAHQGWFVKRESGECYETDWGGTSLDMTHPGAREHVRRIAYRAARDWGYRYFKLDGLYTGAAVRQVYVNDGYREDEIGEAVFHNPEKTNVEALRDGLKLIRTAAGPDVFILGCCAPQNMRSFGGSFGLVDAMRIGPDNGAGWPGLMLGPIHGSRKYFLHGRVWYNDPDPLYVRADMPLNHARLICSWVTISGQMNMSSEWLPGLPADRLDILKRTMPPHGLLPRPVDLFENDPPRIWLLTDDRGDTRRDVVALYNWDAEPQEFRLSPRDAGLPSADAYIAFDYWEDRLLPAFSDWLVVTVPGQSCSILSTRPALDRPQLISTSRHITQGIVDVTDERWDTQHRTLSGRSRVVAGDPYELRITCPPGWKAPRASAAAVDGGRDIPAVGRQEGDLLRVRIDSSESRDVEWRVSWGETA